MFGGLSFKLYFEGLFPHRKNNAEGNIFMGII